MQRRHGNACRSAILLVAIAGTMSAQPAADRSDRGTLRVVGSVRDSVGAPIALADVQLVGSGGWHQGLLTDATGRFGFAAVPAGAAQLEVRRLGFRPMTRSLTVVASSEVVDSTRIVLLAATHELAGVEVTSRAEDDVALSGFYARRRSNNFGHYLDRAEIEATHAQRPSEALRAVPGLLIQPSRRVGNTVRIRNCRPTVWVDGVRLQDAELDEVASVEDVAAVEIYKSLAGMPQQFIDRTNPCGGILIWSRNH